MTEWPQFVQARLDELCVSRRFPAYLQVRRDGCLDAVGGALSRYGLDGVRGGMRAADRLDVLEGMLPTDGTPFTVPLVLLAGGVYADLYFFPESACDWVLLLDATDVARERSELQQYAHELDLLREAQERVLRQMQGRQDDLAAVLNQLRLNTAIVDATGRLVFLSQGGRRLLAEPDREPSGQMWDTALAFDAESVERMREQWRRPATGRLRVPVTVAAPGRRFRMEVEIRDDDLVHGRRVLCLHDVSELYALREALDAQGQFCGLVGRAPVMEEVFQLVRDVAAIDVTVLIHGETGTGKELVARAIHQLSPRHARPFVVVNCAGLSDTLINSELFGHRKGAFTDAIRDQEGLFEAAQGGTILLDEIGDIPMPVQTRILRVLEEREVVRIGETLPRRIDVRVLAATNKDLATEVRQGRFRLDLLYRIRVARVALPALRKRAADIPALASTFLAKSRTATGKAVAGVSDAAMRVLMAYAWPGNVRELRNAIDFALIRCKTGTIEVKDLPPEPLEAAAQAPERYDHPVDVERERILEALRSARGRRGKAAELLGISRATLYRRMKACFPGTTREEL